eukprot:scaffold647991_cov35-Prasinocladus_malaysianus.AAC.2
MDFGLKCLIIVDVLYRRNNDRVKEAALSTGDHGPDFTLCLAAASSPFSSCHVRGCDCTQAGSTSPTTNAAWAFPAPAATKAEQLAVASGASAPPGLSSGPSPSQCSTASEDAGQRSIPCGRMSPSIVHCNGPCNSATKT